MEEFPTQMPTIEGVDHESLNRLLDHTTRRHGQQAQFNLTALDDTDLSVTTPLVQLTIDGQPISFKVFRLCLAEEDNAVLILESDWIEQAERRHFVALAGVTAPDEVRRQGDYRKLVWTPAPTMCVFSVTSQRGEDLCNRFYRQSYASLFNVFGL